MRKCCTGNVTQNGYGRVGVAFAGKDELTQRASAKQYRTKTNNQHTHEVPKMYRVCNRLAGETKIEVSGSDVANEGCDNNCNKSQK